MVKMEDKNESPDRLLFEYPCSLVDSLGPPKGRDGEIEEGEREHQSVVCCSPASPTLHSYLAS